MGRTATSSSGRCHHPGAVHSGQREDPGGYPMAARPVLPLYLLITGLAIVLVLVIGGTVRWLGQGQPGSGVFLAQLALAGLFSLGLARWLTRPLRRLGEE